MATIHVKAVTWFRNFVSSNSKILIHYHDNHTKLKWIWIQSLKSLCVVDPLDKGCINGCFHCANFG